MELIRLLVVDDHTLFRRGLIALLSQDERFQVTGQAGDIGEALRCVAQQPRRWHQRRANRRRCPKYRRRQSGSPRAPALICCQRASARCWP